MFFRRPHQWAHLITPELRHHFANVVGYELVQHDVKNHNYRDPNKHRAAIAWLHDEDRKKSHAGQWVTVITLVLAAAGVIAGLLAL